MLAPYGNNIKLFIEGGSHDEKIEMLLDNFPKGMKIDEDALLKFMQRRAPGNDKWSTPRKEKDMPVFLSGVKDGITTGERIHAVIYNQNQHSSDYSSVTDIPRPSHADFAAVMKYGDTVDLRGGGHFSGRLTSLMCIAGALCRQYLKEKGIEIFAHINSIGNIYDTPFDKVNPDTEMLSLLDDSRFPVLNDENRAKMQQLIEEMRQEGNSVGGTVECAVTGLPAGLGEHLFAGAEGRIASMVFSIPAVKGVEFGAGFSSSQMTGIENNDAFYYDEDTVRTKTNNCGGILGGMTNGMPLIFTAAFKPTPSIALEQDSVSLKEKKNVRLAIKGRHDPCIVPRAVPVIQAAAAIALTDMLLDKKEAE